MTRILHLIRKEFLELRQDPRLFGIVIMAPLIQLTMLGYAATTDVRNVPLVVVGPGRSELESAGIAVPSAVKFAGRAGDAELRALYENALCLAFPSRTEGFGLPPVEAMLCGCPSVVAPAGAIPL